MPKWWLDVYRSLGLGPVLVLAGIVLAVTDTGPPWLAALFVLLGTSVIAAKAWKSRPRANTRVADWINRQIRRQVDRALDDARPAGLRGDPMAFMSEVGARLDENADGRCDYAAALCGKKAGLVPDPAAYYRMFLDFAANAATGDLRMIRCFTSSSLPEHLAQHVDRPGVLPLTLADADERKLEAEFQGFLDLCREGVGFVLFVVENTRAEAVVHEFDAHGAPIFWWTEDRVVMQRLALLFRRMCAESREYGGHREALEAFCGRLDDAVARMRPSIG